MKNKLYMKIFSIFIFVISLFYGLIACHVSKPTLAVCSVTSITITPTNVNINSGATQQFTALGNFSDGLTKDITSSVVWNSSNTAVATIASDGLATAVLPGLPAIIHASLPASCSNALTSNSAILTVVPRFAYVANASFVFGSGTLSVCNIDAQTGLFSSSCQATGGPFLNPTNVTIHTFGDKIFAYVTDPTNLISTDKLQQCVINPTTGMIQSCDDATRGSFIFTAPITMVFYQAASGKLYAYINDNYNTVFKCSVNLTTGAFYACRDSKIGSILSNFVGINYNTSEQNRTYFYISESRIVGENSIGKCPVNSNGDILSECAILTSFDSPVNTAFFSPSLNENYAYVVETDHANLISKCILDSKGSFTSANCSDATTGVQFTQPLSSIFIAINDMIFVYITDGIGNDVRKCELNSVNGNFTNCMDSGAGTNFFDYPSLNPAFF